MHAVSTNFAKPTPNLKMTSYYDVTNSVYPFTFSTIRHSTVQYWNLLGGHNQTSSRHRPYPIEKNVLEKILSDLLTLFRKPNRHNLSNKYNNKYNNGFYGGLVVHITDSIIQPKSTKISLIKSVLSAINCNLHFNKEYSVTDGNSYRLTLVLTIDMKDISSVVQNIF